MDPIQPFENDKDRWKPVTAKMLIKMLKTIPGNYEIRYDSAMGEIHKGDFKIYHDTKEVSING